MENNSEMDVKGKGAGALRDSAEKKLNNSPGVSPELKYQTPEEIIHELRVHKVELEMQNEELKRIQLVLEASTNKYQDLYDFAPVGYFTVTQKGIIKDVNLAGASLLGTPRPKLIGRGFGHFIAPESEDQWRHHILEVRLEGVTQSQDIMLKPEDGSTCFTRLESVCIAQSAEPQGENNGGQMISMAVTDITERKKAEEMLRRSEEG